jgi:ferritin-like metal-binding protein YciE
MLDTVFTGMKLKPEGKHCDGIAGIITEGDGTIRDITKSTVLDAGLVAGGRRAEHYEIAAYRALIAMGQALGYTEACTTLGKILKEEEAADSKLTGLGVTLNKAAALEVSAHV